MRSALAALVTTVMLAAGCSDEGPSVNYPAGPGTTSESASPAPAKLHWKVAEPVFSSYLGIYTQEDAEQVWNQAVELVKKWHLNPRLLQTRHYFPRELNPVAKLMAPKLARQWRSDVRRAIRSIDRGGPPADPVPMFNIFSLVVWNLPTPADGAWRNPMVSRPEIAAGAVLPAIEGLRVTMKVTANFRIDRGTEDALQPYSTVLQLYYRVHEAEDDAEDDGEWLLEVYSGKWKLGQEILDKPKKKKKRSDRDADATASSVG